jgi:UDPglucose 6-dehydrogenase
MHEALTDANALVIVTEWSEFRVPNYRMMSKLMTEKVIFDGRNIYEPSEMVEHGFSYYSIGRTPKIANGI